MQPDKCTKLTVPPNKKNNNAVPDKRQYFIDTNAITIIGKD